MQVFISHSEADSELAREVARYLEQSGLDAWEASSVLPGENWAAEAADALERSKAMIVLLTPASVRSRNVRGELQYALGNLRFGRRVVSVLAAPPESVPEEEIPWILRRFPLIKVPDVQGDSEALKEVADVLKAAYQLSA